MKPRNISSSYASIHSLIAKCMGITTLVIFLCLNIPIASAKNFQLSSPDNLGDVQIEVTGADVFYSYSKNGTQAIQK